MIAVKRAPPSPTGGPFPALRLFISAHEFVVSLAAPETLQPFSGVSSLD